MFGYIALRLTIYHRATDLQPTQGGAAAGICGFRMLQQLSRFGLLGADTVGAENALLPPIGNSGNGSGAVVEHASDAPEHWSVEALVVVVVAERRRECEVCGTSPDVSILQQLEHVRA